METVTEMEGGGSEMRTKSAESLEIRVGHSGQENNQREGRRIPRVLGVDKKTSEA